jgi:L-ascorbate metabolism protein UlaG (beta-lactamase superfamily)
MARNAPRFTNLDGSGPPKIEDVLKWSVRDKLIGRRRKTPSRAQVPTVAPDLAKLATPPEPGEPARLTWLGHATWLVQLDGTSLLIDPVMGDSISGMVRRNVPVGVPAASLPRISACLVTHNHRDHLDLPSLVQVGAPVVAGLGTGPLVKQARLSCTELGWWQSAKVGPLTVHFVPSQHWSRRGALDSNAMLWGGFIIEGVRARLYHAGDSAYFEGFAEIGKRYPGLDAALLPIGAYEPGWFMEKQHMNPEQAVQAFVDLGAARFFAMHWGTFKLTDEALDEPPKRFEAEWARRALAADRRFVLPVGGSADVAS